MKLNLKRPVVFFDLETTGLDTAHSRIVEISMIKVFPDGHDEERTMRINPECHIPEECTAIHHISDDDVRDCPRFRDVADDVAAMFEDCDVAGFNSNRFDVPLLMAEMERAGVSFDASAHRYIDVQNIYHKLAQRTLTAAYRTYCGKDLTEAHAASADTRATYEVLQAQLDQHAEELENDVTFLSEFSSYAMNVDLGGRFVYKDKDHRPEEIMFNFGRYKGKTIKSVLAENPGYYGWMMDADFPADTKQVLKGLRDKYAW